MASPIGHTLIAFLALGPGHGRDRRWIWLFLAAAATIAPDLDFLPGLAVGEINRFHHGASHSLGAAALFGVLAALAAGWSRAPRLRVGITAAGLYASHIVLDLITVDTRPPVGQPIFWPVSSRYFALANPVLHGIRHNAEGGLGGFVRDVVSLHNLNAATREVLLVAPVVLLVWFVARRWAGTTSRSRGPVAHTEGDLVSRAPEPCD